MGRTIPSYGVAIDMEIAKWKPFRDVLRKPEKDFFKSMLLRSKLYASAGGMAVRPVVLEAVFTSIFLDHHIRLLELAAEIENIKDPKDAEAPEGIEKWLERNYSCDPSHVDTSEPATKPESF